MKATSGLLNCNSQTKGWRHYDSIHLQSFFSSRPTYTEADHKLCRWRRKTKGLEAGTMCHPSIQLYQFIIFYLQASQVHDRSRNSLSPGMMEASADVIISLLQSDMRIDNILYYVTSSNITASLKLCCTGKDVRWHNIATYLQIGSSKVCFCMLTLI